MTSTHPSGLGQLEAEAGPASIQPDFTAGELYYFEDPTVLAAIEVLPRALGDVREAGR